MNTGEAILLLGVLAVLGLVAAALLRSRLRSSTAQDNRPLPEADHQATTQLAGLELDLLEEAVIHLDASLRITYANAAAEILAGAAEGRSLIEATRDHDLENLVQTAVETGAEQRGTVALTRLDRTVQARVRPVDRRAAILVLADRTETMHLRQVRRELVANISHELRTPLATLQLLVDTLLEGADEDPEARRGFLQSLHEQIIHLSSIVQQSLYLASLESGESRISTRPVSALELVQRCASRLLPQARQAGIHIQLELPGNLPRVRADAEQVDRALTNLLDNAITWSPVGGTVVVSADHDDGFVRFGVCDSGPGVPREMLPRLFERFYKGDAARSGGGTGLGLAIAKHTVLMHGGRIWAESEEGQGAAFYFTLPAAATMEAPREGPGQT